MKLNIANIGNKEWLDFKTDTTFGLYHAMKDLGHDVTVSINQLISDKLNIIIGADFLANEGQIVENLVNSKIEYVIYEIEKFEDFKINDRPNFNAHSYRILIESAKFIITPYLFNFKSYSKYLETEKVRYARWGFHESMVNKNISRSHPFEFNGLFFGLLKGARVNKMKNLRENKRTRIRCVGRDDPVLYKEYFISSCKWGLNLSYGEAEEFINPFRLYSMGSNGMPILADGGNDDDNYLSLCKIADFSDFESHLCQDVEESSHTIERFREIRLSDNLKEIF